MDDRSRDVQARAGFRTGGRPDRRRSPSRKSPISDTVYFVAPREGTAPNEFDVIDLPGHSGRAQLYLYEADVGDTEYREICAMKKEQFKNWPRFAITSDGKRVLCKRDCDWWFYRDLATGTVTCELENAWHVKISPDGRFIVFVSATKIREMERLVYFEKQDYFVSYIDGTGRTQLTHDGRIKRGDISISSDGRSFTYGGPRREVTVQLPLIP